MSSKNQSLLTKSKNVKVQSNLEQQRNGPDSDIEMEEGILYPEEGDIGENKDHQNTDGNDEGDDIEDDNEESILNRLTGNYRRFSETHRSNSFLDTGNENDEGEVENGEENGYNAIQLQERRLRNQDYSYDDDFEGEFEDEEVVDHVNFHDNEDEGNTDNTGSENEEADYQDDDAIALIENALRTRSGHINGLEATLAALSSVSGNRLNNRTNSRVLNTDITRDVDSRNDNGNERSSNDASGGPNMARESLGRMFMSSFFDDMLRSGTSRLDGLMEGLRTQTDPYLILETLNELSSSLLMMNSMISERQISTYSLSKLLVELMENPSYQEDLEIQLVACRCLYNLSEVNFESIPDMVSAGVIECLNSKLLDISYMDLAEQALQALEMISRRSGRQIMSKGCIPACLNYLDFFTIHAQRKSLTITANSSELISISRFENIKDIFPIIERVATEYTDPVCVESAWLVVSRVIKSFQRHPKLLEQLITSHFLKKLCGLIPGCLGNGNNSGNLVSFKTCIGLLDSLTILSNCLPNISVVLLKECFIGEMINRSLSKYEKSKADNVAENINLESDMPNIKVSIDALLASPKELLISFLKLIASLLPLKLNVEKGKKDIGNFFGVKMHNDRLHINRKKFEQYSQEDANLTSFHHFLSIAFPLLLNIYNSTVDYKLRRLVLICLLRAIDFMNEDELASIVYESNITSILVASIIQGKRIMTKNDPSLRSSIKCYVLIYGSLLITHLLIGKTPDLFLRDFEREGLVSHTKELLSILNSDGTINKPFRLDKQSDPVGMHKEDGREGNLHFEEENAEEDEDENEEENEDDNVDENVEEEDEENQTELTGMDDSFNNSSSFKRIPFLFVDDYTISDDGTQFLSMDSILYGLNELCSEVNSDYDTLYSTNGVPKEKHLQNLDHTFKVLERSLNERYSYSEWYQIWEKLSNTLLSNENSKNVSSFELVSSGIVLLLLKIFEKEEDDVNSVTCKSFKDYFCSVLSPIGNNESLPLVLLIRKLEDALDRSESFEIVGSDLNASLSSNSTSRASSMAKQVKLKLVSADRDTSEGGKQLMLMVHAIATFNSINSFLKNRFNSMNSLRSIFTPGDGSQANESSGQNYYLEFSIHGEVIPQETTIYGAIYKSLQKHPGEIVPNSLIWSYESHVVNFSKVQGTPPSFEEELYAIENTDDDLTSLGDSTTVNILKLLKKIYSLNSITNNSVGSDALFLNYKLTAKLNRQLEEPMIVASGTLPDWAVIITRQFPFLFPLDTRIFFLKSTSFGYSRLIDMWQAKSKQDNDSLLNRAQLLGRSVRHKLRLSRNKLFQSAIKVMDGYADKPGLLEIEYFEEVGTGLGPTLEFYANVSKELCKVKNLMWRSDKYVELKKHAQLSKKVKPCEDEAFDIYVDEKTGLFPRPLDEDSLCHKKVLEFFSMLGKFLARSFLDSRIVDFNFNSLFFEIALDLEFNQKLSYSRDLGIEKIKQIDPNLAASLLHLNKYLTQYDNIQNERRADIQVDDCKLSELMLTFVLPGYEEIKLTPNGEEIPINSENLGRYIDAIINKTLDSGIKAQILAFIEGFSVVFPFSSMLLFSAEELVRLSGNDQEDWTMETLLNVVHADHGYNIDSRSIKWLIEIISEFDEVKKRQFLQFLTGSPRLPIGGFKALSPVLTVVLKHCEDDLQPDDYLPSVMTCANYLKLPNYSSKTVMKKKLYQAMTEGANVFLLS